MARLVQAKHWITLFLCAGLLHWMDSVIAPQQRWVNPAAWDLTGMLLHGFTAACVFLVARTCANETFHQILNELTTRVLLPIWMLRTCSLCTRPLLGTLPEEPGRVCDTAKNVQISKRLARMPRKKSSCE